MSLTRYRAKRDFTASSEPRGGKSRRAQESNRFLFVIQKHDATRLHYDFRIEYAGVLKSWAVPKGLPFSKGDKRLAMEVEDHPVEYADFEGTIPSGNYGAGTVMLWEAGICEIINAHAKEAFRSGKLELLLAGQKVKGHWTLVRMKPAEDEDKVAWLLIKTGEDAKPISARAEDRSVKTGRTMKQIAADADETWQSNRKTKSAGRLRHPVRASRGRPVRRG